MSREDIEIRLYSIIGEDHQLVYRLLSQFQAETTEMLLGMQKAAEQNDVFLVQKLAGRMKSTIDVFGMTKEGNILRTIESTDSESTMKKNLNVLFFSFGIFRNTDHN
jgi:hypothetical protein